MNPTVAHWRGVCYRAAGQMDAADAAFAAGAAVPVDDERFALRLAADVSIYYTGLCAFAGSRYGTVQRSVRYPRIFRIGWSAITAWMTTPQWSRRFMPVMSCRWLPCYAYMPARIPVSRSALLRHPFGHAEEIVRWSFHYRVRWQHDPECDALSLSVFHYRSEEDALRLDTEMVLRC